VEEGGVVDYTSGASSLIRTTRRSVLRFTHRPWSILTPTAALLAGLLFTTTANTAAGTDLRNDRRPELKTLITERRLEVDEARRRRDELRHRIEGATTRQAGSDKRVAEQRDRFEALRPGAGLTALRGPGLTVNLDDAPRRADGTRPPNARPDDLVVHQQDVQATVNALWAGGAEAMSIMGVRVISTSAVRCVGNTLLLDGRVYSPPFEITAIGDPGRLQRALDASEGVRLFRDAATAFGLGYQVRVEGEITVPAYSGSTALRSNVSK
jgi:uncharacterized protein YlxW (UPF0749 family)